MIVAIEHMHPWRFIPKQIHNLMTSNTPAQEQWTENLTVMLLLSSWIESVCYVVLIEGVENKSLQEDKVIEKIESATWSEYKKLLKKIYSKNIAELTTADNKEAIEMIYNFRNKVIHGKPIVAKFQTGKKIKYQGVHHEIQSYLIRKEMVRKDESIYKRKIIQHFVKVTSEFALSMINLIEVKEISECESYDYGEIYRHELKELKFLDPTF